MAYENKEVEINVELSEEDFNRIRKKLSEIAIFVKKTRNVDEYFTPKHRNFVEKKFPREWLSLRYRGEKAILNYKHWYPDDVEVADYCDEFETEINNAEQFKKILSALDFIELVTVDKERETFSYNNEIEIKLDNVKDLGFFIEIESIKDFGSVEKTREKLFEFAKLINVGTSKLTNGYPLKLMKKKELVK